MDLDTFYWLLSTQGQDLLVEATTMYAEGMNPIRAGERLRRVADPAHAAAAMSQIMLRQAAVEKFGVSAAARMYFTPEGLEQATRRRVSIHRAARVAAAAPESVVDLGCGIGGDLIAFSDAGLTVAGVDLDPVLVAVANANLSALNLPGAVMQADATALDLDGFGVAFADPARRNAAGRVFSVNDYTPSWSFVTQLLQRPACVKVAPGIPHQQVPPGAEAEWVSDDGDVKEAALWSPQLSTASRRATVIRANGLASLTDADDPGAGTRPVGRYIYEPDGAVIRAGLVTAVAAAVGGGLVDQHIAYVTSDVAITTPFARGYEIQESLPYKERQLKAALRQRRIGRLTIKKRGVDVVPDQLRKRLGLKGENEATIILTRVAGAAAVFLVRPL